MVRACIEEILDHDPERSEELGSLLRRVGWGLSGFEPYPLTLQLDVETTQLPENIREGVTTCLRRYRDGDAAGAMTSICGIVDDLTGHVYASQALGDHRRIPYHTRVVQALRALESACRQPLAEGSVLLASSPKFVPTSSYSGVAPD